MRDILVDDAGHRDDLERAVSAVLDSVSQQPPQDLRNWLATEFFGYSLKVHSKSRRAAPIYWQLAPPSRRYSVWLYSWALTTDTLYRVQNEYLAPKLIHEERRLASLRTEIGASATVGERRQLMAQETLVEELRVFAAEVKRVAPLWRPNLDDGVIINFAPLWRLVPHHSAWQKALKTAWDGLCAGDFDWAHLAMHLWPDRIVPKCASDRSLAIAHDLDDVFWMEGAKGKWTARDVPTRSVEELVRERSSPAVKVALQSLVEAPVGITTAQRRTRNRESPALTDLA